MDIISYNEAKKARALVEQNKIDIDGKQDKLVAGSNISISASNVISSATGGGSIEVVDNLVSTDKTKALSANQGKVLNDKISNLSADDIKTIFNLSGAIEQRGKELIINGGFETLTDGKPNDYMYFNTIGTINIETTDPKSGSNYIKLTKTKEGPSYEIQLQKYIILEPNKEYELSFWTKGDGENDGSYAIYNGIGQHYYLSNTGTGVYENSWKKVTTVIKTLSTNQRIYLWFRPSDVINSSACYDDVSLKEITTKEVEGETLSLQTVLDNLPSSSVKYDNTDSGLISNDTQSAITELSGIVKGDNNLLNLPSKYELVVGDTFELFYKGIILSKNPYNYDVKIIGTKGKQYSKRFIYTPLIGDVGTHLMTIQIRNDSGLILSEKTTSLIVKQKAINPPAKQNVLCVGDSLTAKGTWVFGLHDRLITKDGLNNLNFIGSCKHSDNPLIGFEGHSGWNFNSYLTATTDVTTNPFWNTVLSKVDFKNYVTTIGETTIDIVYILLGWNDSYLSRESYKANAISFITKLKTDFPNVKITLVGLQVPSLDGIGENYGVSWNYMDKVRYVFNLDKWYKEIADEISNVDMINLSGQFDADNNIVTGTRAVNNRNETIETYGTNGVHPPDSGQFQITDAVYRNIQHKI